MSQRRNNASQKYALCLSLEVVNGHEEEIKTVVPKRWVDEENEILWWPNSNHVMNKRFCDPDDSWRKYKLIKVLVEGKAYFYFIFQWFVMVWEEKVLWKLIYLFYTYTFSYFI